MIEVENGGGTGCVGGVEELRGIRPASAPEPWLS